MDWMSMIPEMPSLAAGSHKEGSNQLCALEMISFMEREKHSDSPECTCPVLASYVRCLNDSMPDSQRDRLKPYLPMLVGTRDQSLERKRSEYLSMQAVTVFAVRACRGVINDSLIDAMASAENLDAAAHAARAAAHAAHAAADAAYAAARAAAYAAAYAATYVADAADAAAYAATYVADADGDIWQLSLDALEHAISIGTPKPAKWTTERARECIAACA